jgi:hypothetical protein
MTIADAAKTVLQSEGRAMHINEIYDAILKQGLYTFGAKDPKAVLSRTVRTKSTANAKESKPLFRQVSEGTYESI